MDVLLKPCIEPLASCLCVHVVYLLNAKKNVDDMKRSMTLLDAKKRDLEKAVKDAEQNNQQPTEQVNLWLKEVADLGASVRSVNEDYEQIGRRHPLHNFIFLNSWSSIHSCGSKAANLKDEVAELLQKRDRITDLTTPMGPDRVQRIAGPSSYVGKAIEQNLQRVLHYLQVDTVGVIGIWGPGGVGKSTLLGRINNSLEGDENLGFDYVIWVVATQDLSLPKLQEAIAERLKLSPNSPPSKIFDMLKNKNFLLLLDDLWEDFDFNEVGIPQPLCNDGQKQRKQKVVLTTRSEAVCSRMQADEAIKVECLEPKEAMRLFREALGKKITSDPEIESLLEKVAEECDGLPIALKTIGKAMSNNKTVHQWKDALRKLQSHTGPIIGMDRVFSRLKISFDSLREDTHKECFLHCSVWAEDCNIPVEDLIWFWLGLRLIDLEKFENVEAAFSFGHSIIENLKEVCLLEESSIVYGAVKMHDVIRDLALQIFRERGSKCIVKHVYGKEPNLSLDEWKEAEKVMFGVEALDVRLHPPHCPNLSILALGANNLQQADFLGSLPALAFLDLSYCGIHELPPAIGCLSDLEFLDLSCTKIKRLPDELANLSKLKFLLLRYLANEILIPKKVIVRLRKLLVLDATRSGVLEAYEDPTEDYDVEDFYMAVHRMKFVSVYEFKISSLVALELLSHVKVRRIFVSNLKTEGQKIFHLRVLSNGMQQIQFLEIMDCAVLEKLVVDNSCLPSLLTLRLKNLPKLREIIWSGVTPCECLPELEILVVQNCQELKDVSWVPQLPSLNELTLSDCDRMEYVIADANPTCDLVAIELHRLPQLCGICDHPIDFHYLTTVTIFDCPKLKRLPFKVQLADNRNLTIEGTQKWWDELIWEDERIRSVLQLHFEAKEEEPAEEELSMEEVEPAEEQSKLC